MDRKGVRSTVAVTAEEVKAALPRTRNLTSEEEKVVRMRHGAAAPDLRAPLPQAAGGNEELKDELLVLEMQLLKAFRQRQAQAKQTANVVAKVGSAPASRAKDKIVRALRKKK